MNTNEHQYKSIELIDAVCHELLLLARQEEALASDEASRTPYWSPTPTSVVGHRAAAVALREDITRLERAARASSVAC